MLERRIVSEWAAGVGLVLILVAATRSAAADRESTLLAQAAQAERILIGIPEKKGVADGEAIDVPPGEKFVIEIQQALRGTGRKSAPALIINSGDENSHPRFVAGKQYVFLLKKDADGKRWLSLGSSEIPIKAGKVQYLVEGRVVEELSLNDFDELVSKDAPAVVDKTPTREALTGNWLVVVSDVLIKKGFDAYLWLVALTNDPKQGTAVRFISSSKLLPATALKSSSITGDAVHLIFDVEGTTVDFRGRFDQGTVLGNVIYGRNQVMPARMVPTELKNMRRYDDAVADTAREEFINASGQEESFGPLSRFVRRHPSSPLALAAYLDLVGLARAEGLDRGKFENLAGAYQQTARRWGPRIQLRASIDIGLELSRHDYLPELALEYLAAADKAFDDETPVDWKQAVEIELGKRLISAGKNPEGIAVLTRIHEEFPFEPEVIYALARQAEKDGKTDDAMVLYGQIAVLPLMEQSFLDALKAVDRKPPPDQYPSRILSRLWKEKHGDHKGLLEWRDELYDSTIRSIATEKRPPRKKDEGTRVVVCELFTNGDCQPCVGIEAALTALESAYAKSEAIVLRYHQNKPGPDPLANEESLERFKQYQCSGTPSLNVNGKRLNVSAGTISEAPKMYRQLRSYIDPLLEEKIDLRLELTAKSDQGKVAISARAAGLKDFPANARLMLVLAEENIECPRKNGVRTHAMVVRTFPGTLAGTSPVKGQLTYTGEVNLSKLRKRLAVHLAATERENEAGFDEKPLALRSLYVVALLQNSESGEVLQAAAVPVTGPTPDPAGTKAASPPGGTKKPATGGN